MDKMVSIRIVDIPVVISHLLVIQLDMFEAILDVFNWFKIGSHQWFNWE